MSKTRKKRKNNSPKQKNDYGLKAAVKQFNWRLAGKLLLSFTIIFSIYLFSLNYAEAHKSPLLQQIVLIIYCSATTVLACAFIFLNRGISNDIPKKEQLRDDWADEKKEEFIEKYIQSKNKAKKLLIVLIPLIFTILFDTIYLLYFVK